MKAMLIKDDDGSFTAVVGKPGRIYTQFVRMDGAGATGPFIVKRKMANGDMDLYSSPLLWANDTPYPIKRIVKHMLRIGRENGITKSAKDFLRGAKT